MQKTIYVTRDSKRYGYHFWSKKPKYHSRISGYSRNMQRWRFIFHLLAKDMSMKF